MSYVLDTDSITAWQHRNARVVSRVTAVSASEIVVTIVSFEKQCAGRLKILNKHNLSTAQRIESYYRLDETLEFYMIVNVLLYDAAAARREDHLRRLLPRIGTKDRRIAAISVTHGATLVTANTVHFTGVPRLLLADWLAP